MNALKSAYYGIGVLLFGHITARVAMGDTLDDAMTRIVVVLALAAVTLWALAEALEALSDVIEERMGK